MRRSVSWRVDKARRRTRQCHQSASHELQVALRALWEDAALCSGLAIAPHEGFCSFAPSVAPHPRNSSSTATLAPRLASGSATAETTAESPRAVATPPLAELLSHTLHSATLLRVHGRGPLRVCAGLLLARLVGCCETWATRTNQAAAREPIARPASALIASLLSEKLPKKPRACARAVRGMASAGEHTVPQRASASEAPRAAPLEASIGVLVTSLLESIGRHGGTARLVGSWAVAALHHGTRLEGSSPTEMRCSLAAYRAMAHRLEPRQLRSHALVLMGIATRCALEPSPDALLLAHEAIHATRALLCCEGLAGWHGPELAQLLAEVFWRSALLLYTDCIPLYLHAALPAS